MHGSGKLPSSADHLEAGQRAWNSWYVFYIFHHTDGWCTFRTPREIILRLSQSGWTTDICPINSSVPTHTWRQGICLECNVDYSSRGGQGDGVVLRPPSGTLHTVSQGFCHTQRWKGWVRLVHLKVKKSQQQKNISRKEILWKKKIFFFFFNPWALFRGVLWCSA